MLCCDFRILPGILLQWFCSVSYLRPAASVDVHADGTVGAAAAHEEMSPVVGLHHSDEVPTAVLEKQTQKNETTTWKEEEEHLWSHLAIKPDLGGFMAEDYLTFRLASSGNLSVTRPHQGRKWENTFCSIFTFLSLWFYEQYKVLLRQQMGRNVCLGQTHRDVWQREDADLMNTSRLLATDKLRLRLCIIKLTHFCLPVGCQRVWKSESNGTFSRWMGWNLRNPHNKMVWALLLFLVGVRSNP